MIDAFDILKSHLAIDLVLLNLETLSFSMSDKSLKI